MLCTLFASNKQGYLAMLVQFVLCLLIWKNSSLTRFLNKKGQQKVKNIFDTCELFKIKVNYFIIQKRQRKVFLKEA